MTTKHSYSFAIAYIRLLIMHDITELHLIYSFSKEEEEEEYGQVSFGLEVRTMALITQVKTSKQVFLPKISQSGMT